jgi:hypothetical protein
MNFGPGEVPSRLPVRRSNSAKGSKVIAMMKSPLSGDACVVVVSAPGTLKLRTAKY